MSPFNLTSVCVMVTKYSSSPPLNWKLSLVWRQILISFWHKSHSDQAVVHPWESPEWSPWFAGIPLNWSSIGQLSKAARPVEKLARTLHGILSEKLNWTVSWDRLHTPAFTISHFIIGRKFGVRYVTSLVTLELLLTARWGQMRLGGWQTTPRLPRWVYCQESTGKLPTDGRSWTHARSSSALAPGRLPSFQNNTLPLRIILFLWEYYSQK